MEIEHRFTEPAEEFLADEVRRLDAELREESVNEAFRSRGKPVEVTASDVRRAAAHFHKKKSEGIRSSGIQLALRLYLWMGIALAVLGALLLLLQPVIDIQKISFIATSQVLLAIARNMIVMGGTLVVLALFLRYYLLRLSRRARLIGGKNE